MRIKINSLLNSTIRFYLKDKYRKFIFTELKERYKDWSIIADKLEIPVRNLFGVRRGWEYRSGKKKFYFINAMWLKRIIDILKLNTNEVEKNVEYVKMGYSGNRSRISLPFEIDFNNEDFYSIKRAIGEYVLMKTIQSNLNFTRSKNMPITKERYISFKPDIKNNIEKFRLRGLKPKLKSNLTHHKLSYVIPFTGKGTSVIVPKEIVFNEYFAKQFGKWIGDRCGGKRKVGVANKNWIFVKEFRDFLKNLDQKNISTILTCSKSFTPSKELINKTKKIKHSKTQYGDYAYRVEVSNSTLKSLVFDRLEKDMHDILFSSKESVRHAFYAGFFEAEGSIIKDSNTISLSFGLNLKNKKFTEKWDNLIKNVVSLNYLLSIDNFNPRISRKISKTKKSRTLKYDIILLNSLKSRSNSQRHK